ncbi:MAG: SpaA isopeptide-forming pilin-related protein [Candidatus Limnocylindria bacterium]
MSISVLAIVALVLSLATLTRPALATHVSGATVELKEAHQGVSSDDPEFAGDEEECADVEAGMVLWHFVANQLSDGTTSGSLTATFETAGDVTVDGYFPGEGTGAMHFDVTLDADDTLVTALATFNVNQTEDANLVLSHVCGGGEGGEEEESGLVEVEKFFCPTDGETRTEFDIFGPTDPISTLQQETDEEGCSVGADVTFTIWQGETLVTTVVTGEDGIVEFSLEPGDYVIREEMSGATASFSVGADQITAIVVTNFVAEEAEEGQLKVLKYFCEAEVAGVEFFTEGQAPNLEDCEPGDAEFTVDDGEPFSTTGGIAVVNLEVGTHVLAEVSTGAATEFDIAAGEITTIIVLNNVESEVSADLALVKEDEEGSPLADVDLNLVGEGDLDVTMTTDELGQVTFTGLAEGTYTLTETANPDETCDTGGSLTVEVSAEGVITITDDDPESGLSVIDNGDGTWTIVNTCVEQEEESGTLEVEKIFCPTDGEARTEFDVFGPVSPTFRVQQVEPGEGCSVGADVTFTIWQGETLVDTVTTDADGIVEISLEPGDYLIREEMSGATAEFTVGADQLTAIVVVNYQAQAAEQGQVKVLKYLCQAEAAGVEFFMEGEAPNLEDCDPTDAEFMLNDGEPFSTVGGIATVTVDVGTHVLTEVSTEASSDEFEVAADAITTIIVLNNVESAVSPGENGNGNGNGNGESGVQGSQGGPGMGGLPDTAVSQPGQGGLPAAALGLLVLAAIGGLGALNLQAVRRRMG